MKDADRQLFWDIFRPTLWFALSQWREIFPTLWRETVWQIMATSGCFFALIWAVPKYSLGGGAGHLGISGIAGAIFFFNARKLFFPLLFPSQPSNESAEIRKIARMCRRIKFGFIRESRKSNKLNHPENRSFIIVVTVILSRLGEYLSREVVTRIDLLMLALRTASFLGAFVIFFGSLYWALSGKGNLAFGAALVHSLGLLSTTCLSPFQAPTLNFKYVESAQVCIQIVFTLLLVPLYLALYDRDKGFMRGGVELLKTRTGSDSMRLVKADLRARRRKNFESGGSGELPE